MNQPSFSNKSKKSGVSKGFEEPDKYVLPFKDSLSGQIRQSVVELEALLDKWQ